MPNADSLRTAERFLFQGLCAAGGLLAPMLTATDHPGAAAALGAGALGMLGGRLVNMWHQSAVDKERSSLPDSSVLLRNHDLNTLVAAALARAIQGAPTGDIPSHYKALIDRLAAQVPAYLRDAKEAAIFGDVLPDAKLPNIVFRFAPGIPQQPSLLDQETRERLLDGLALRLDDSTGYYEIKSVLSNHIALHFDDLVIAVFKEDATGRGPSQGRGWAALTLLFWGQMLSGIRAIQTSQTDLTLSLRDTEVRLTAKLDQLVRWNGPIAFTHSDGLAEWLNSIHHDLSSKLDEIKELIGHGLLSPEEFRVSYWLKRRQDPGLELLWQDVSRAEILTGSLVGRSAQVADFEKFLKTSSPWVQFWKGWPGTGKSRLMIEFAERATALGYRVFFVSPDVHDLKSALLRIQSTEPVVLLWDDYQGENADALRVFLNLQNPSGATIKRVITSWPTHNVLGEKARDPLYAERELQAIVPIQELVVYARRLFPKLTPPEAKRVVEVAESQPEAMLRAILLLLQGATIDHLPPNLLESAYDNLIVRLLKSLDSQDRAAVKKALVAMALVASINLGSEEQRHAFEEAGISDEALGILSGARTVACADQVYSLNLDGFRSHIIRRSLDHQRTDVLSGTPKELAKLAQPLFEEWFDTIWGICVLASNDTAHSNSIRQELLAAFDQSDWSLEQATRLAPRIMDATVGEPDPRKREALADRIGGLLARYDNAEIALSQAKALYNATVGEPDPRKREALADRIGGLLARYDNAEIALSQAKALHNATAVEPDPRKLEALADRIGGLLARYDNAEIALSQAKALYNATAVEPDPGKCEELANRIGGLLARYDNAEIALRQAKALYNATVGEPDPGKCEELANRIGGLLARYDNAEIALSQAEALYNATVVEPDPRKREALADRIGGLLARYDNAEIAFEQAKALYNATVVEPDPRKREALADRIGGLLARYDNAEIALRQAKALYNATAVEPDPRKSEALYKRIKELETKYGFELRKP